MANKKKVLIIGAGPAGLTAGAELARTKQCDVALIERDAVVGGIARTIEYKGCRFDIGPHHYITDSHKILQWWKNVMGDDFIKHKRFTRIYYKKYFFTYPLAAGNVLRGLNLWACTRSIFSYIKIRLFPIKEIYSFQDWVTNRFGAHLFSIFFKTYTEKVWGVTCDKISADWAAERIKGFSLSKAIFYAFFGRWFTKNKPRTINDVFYYPSRGSGTLWEKVADEITTVHGMPIDLQAEVVGVEHKDHCITAVLTRSIEANGVASVLTRRPADYFLSSMPLRQLVLSMDPVAPAPVIAATKLLSYRGLVTVNLIVNKAHVCPDHWLYIHEKEVRMGRVGNMNNFSLKMVDDVKHTALSLEYFAFTNEPFWTTPDHELIELGKHELEKIGLINAAAILDGMVIRTAEAYPVYDSDYKQYLLCVLNYLSTFKNLQLMGRNGTHSYNNMDIAMLSAMGAVNAVLDREKIRQRPAYESVDSVFLT